MREGSLGGATGLTWLAADHLNSTSLTINPSDYTQFSEIRYSPWGETRYTTPNATIPTDRKYTGQREEAALGLYYYNARWYDPALSHFIMADTIIPGADNPQAWDRYAYTSNNPIRYNDPSGHAQSCADGDAGGGCGEASTVEQIFRSFDYEHGGKYNGLFAEYYAKLFKARMETAKGNPLSDAYWADAAASYQYASSFVPQRDVDPSSLIPGAMFGLVSLSMKDGGTGNGVILFGKPGKPSEPQTYPGKDGKVSCSSCSPEEGIENSFKREPTEDDMYWVLDVDKVKAAGGHIEYDGGLPITDVDGNPLGGTYPRGHVSVSFPGQSKSGVAKMLLGMLGPGQRVIK